MDKRIGVIAGSPTDAAMGVAYFARWDYHALPYPMGKSGAEQAHFQQLPSAERQQLVSELAREIKATGARAIVIYCNALSASVDMDAVAQAADIPIITPLHAYARLAGQYRSFGVLAANGCSLQAVEKTIQAANPVAELFCASNMRAVTAVEAGQEASAIIHNCGIDHLWRYFHACQAEVLLLACTHFPYFRAALAAMGNIPIIDPAETMLQLLKQIME